MKISDVARDSGVALGTLYRYFASKEHLFAAAFVEWQGALKKKLEKEPRAVRARRSVIFNTVNSVLDGSLRSWVMNRATMGDVYGNVDNAIRLIYEYCPQQGMPSI